MKTEAENPSILDESTFFECRHNDTLMRDCIEEFMRENGFLEDDIPQGVAMTVLVTMCATVAIRSGTGPQVTMRRVVEDWDSFMLYYAGARTARGMTQHLMEQDRIVLPS